MADSLSDDFAIDENFSVHSNQSADGDAVDIGSDNEEAQWDNQSVFSHQDRDESQPSVSKARGNQVDQNQTPSENKKRKRKEHEKARKAKKAEENRQIQSISIATQPKSYQADYLYNKMKKSFDKLSQMELEELRIKEEMLQEVEFRKERSMENLPEFLKQALPSLSTSIEELSKSDPKSKDENGSPLICLITGNALRATDLARALRNLLPSNPSKEEKKPSKKKSKPNPSQSNPTSTSTSTSESSSSSSSPLTVAKLFSRHLKVSAQIEFLKTSKTPLAVGTPNRILSLIQNDEKEKGGLKLERTKLLVLDLSWLDSKEMNLLDVKENRDEVFKLLTCEKVREEMKEGRIKVVCW